MPVFDYDDTLMGQYIRAVENPDSAGYNAVNHRWYSPTLKGYDKNNRGFGIDVEQNDKAHALTSGRKGQWLSEEEERNLRNQHIKYAQDVIDKNTPAGSLSYGMSPEMRATAAGVIYRGDGKKLWNQNNSLGKAYSTGDEQTFDKAVQDYYTKRNLHERVRNHQRFMQEQKQKKESEQAIPTAVQFLHNEQQKFDDWWKGNANIKAEGGSMNKDWKDLSMREKRAYIRAGVRNGLTTIGDIRQAYNKFALGGNLYGGGGEEDTPQLWSMPSQQTQRDIAQWEGDSMKTNRSFSLEARDFVRSIPQNIRAQVLSNPQLADKLFSYSYNVGASRFRERVVPALISYYTGNGTIEDIQKSMWASGDKKARGLARRRQWERNGVKDALWDTEMQRLNQQINNPVPPIIDFDPASLAVKPITYMPNPVENTTPAFLQTEEVQQDPNEGLKALYNTQQMLLEPQQEDTSYMDKPLTYSPDNTMPYVVKANAMGGNLYRGGGWVRSRGVNGEYGWLNLQTGQFSTTNPDTGKKEATVQQTTTVKRQPTIETRSMADVAADRAVRKRAERQQYDAQHGAGTYDAQESKKQTAYDISTTKPDAIGTAAGYAADAIDGAMMGASMIPGMGKLAGMTYWGLKGAKDASQGNYLLGALEASPIFFEAAPEAYFMGKSFISNNGNLMSKSSHIYNSRSGFNRANQKNLNRQLIQDDLYPEPLPTNWNQEYGTTEGLNDWIIYRGQVVPISSIPNKEYNISRAGQDYMTFLNDGWSPKRIISEGFDRPEIYLGNGKFEKIPFYDGDFEQAIAYARKYGKVNRDVADAITNNYVKAMSRRREPTAYGMTLGEQFLTKPMRAYRLGNSYLIDATKSSPYFTHFSHFAPSNLREGSDLIKLTANSSHPIVFTVTDDLAPMLERSGYIDTGNTLLQPFNGMMENKRLFINPAAESLASKYNLSQIDPSSLFSVRNIFKGNKGIKTNVDYKPVETMIDRMETEVPYEGQNPFNDGKMTWFRKWALDNGASVKDIARVEKELRGNGDWKALKKWSKGESSYYAGNADEIIMKNGDSDWGESFMHEVEHRLRTKLFGTDVAYWSKNAKEIRDLIEGTFDNGLWKILGNDGYYYVKGNEKEVFARLSQIKTDLNIPADQKLTVKNIEDYLKGVKEGKFADNDVLEMFGHIKSLKGLAKLAELSKFALGTIPAITVADKMQEE